ncbi:protein of unknown function [Cohaesibacter sp. ES.047]|uniref:Card1-like endonuclease domain-containing protein n=1 Tax=Cohaesibacter sp. ES.047 TaxID=1798205 RepID=UPI000BB87B53|nr:DUF1887 family CARF protein [Cohaesibacter sp. ES.047]SNY93287.1 protein of unknown function [Cohaesibacter sp. ES.047]
MTIEKLIEGHGATLDIRNSGDLVAAQAHKPASIAIANDYRVFERIRKRLFKGQLQRSGLSQTEARIIKALEAVGLAGETPEGTLGALTSSARRFITGGWLEEVSCLAALEAGADQALFGQHIRWSIDGYHGENEVDVIARFGERLAFYSCKAYGATFKSSNDRSRKKLMQALHEADNLGDHFGGEKAYVGLIISSDLYDEIAREPKYEGLFGKARALKVDLITLEELEWPHLVEAMGRPKSNN